MTANVTYNTLGLVTTIVYGNGAKVEYTYDLARRVTRIKHGDVLGALYLEQVYTYTADDLPEMITESGISSGSATVTFTYDKRRRLIHEVRTANTAVPGYDIAYGYDAGGNRTVKTEKIDAQTDRVTEYTYDRSSPATYQSNNNRLESYDLYDTSGQAQTLLSTTYYYSN